MANGMAKTFAVSLVYLQPQHDYKFTQTYIHLSIVMVPKVKDSEKFSYVTLVIAIAGKIRLDIRDNFLFATLRLLYIRFILP